MDDNNTYQLQKKGAKFYEKNFVPSLFQKWAEISVQKLSLKESDHLLDVACGTGIVARTARDKKIENLKITGCDINPGMLEVASEIDPEINWVKGNAENLPFENDSFEKISCQFGLMFFKDPVKAIMEMNRVKRKNGKIIIAIWDKVEANEGYFDLLQLVENIGGKDLGLILRSPFNLGDKDLIDKILKLSKTPGYELETIQSFVEFPSIEHWIDCDVKASPIADKITDQQYSSLQREAKKKLYQYVDDDQKVRFNMSAHILTLK
ncbi:class I SAM-dependent methyltransferase [Gramella sp. KN1008]|uniref:class I SAM-dependent methyltransferase n=1 Tax=Gramella sp. KN1008 TaxID=2529298 RepID=UPI00103C3522|nr:methyltransferase domain-containing protein [Gramella sp. KN1008]TBW30008.1 methyltransferase domain-containing protein [Gramella sp. KN1008]